MPYDTNGDYVDAPKEMQLFLEGIIYLSQKYNLSLAHEDREGSFLIQKYSSENISWLRASAKDY